MSPVSGSWTPGRVLTVTRTPYSVYDLRLRRVCGRVAFSPPLWHAAAIPPWAHVLRIPVASKRQVWNTPRKTISTTSTWGSNEGERAFERLSQATGITHVRGHSGHRLQVLSLDTRAGSAWELVRVIAWQCVGLNVGQRAVQFVSSQRSSRCGECDEFPSTGDQPGD